MMQIVKMTIYTRAHAHTHTHTHTHSATSVQSWFDGHEESLRLPWPAQLPDLTIIKLL